MGAIMQKPSSNELLDETPNARRQFLQQLAGAGAAVTASAALPAVAQEDPPGPSALNVVPGRSGSIAETLADYAVSLRYEDLPADVVRTAKRTILDTVGCAIGSYQ